MVHAGDALGLHEAVVQRAKELFAGFRDDREMVQQFKGVIAACLVEAFNQLSRDGRQLLKKQAGEDAGAKEEEGSKVLNTRASRRNELHSATLAGKGGLLLDTTVVSHGGVAGGSLNDQREKASITGQPFETKPAATWDMEDCKSWMIEATKSIAKSWVNAQNSTTVTDDAKPNGNNNPAIKKGTKDELEGMLVEHTLKLSEHLELELKKTSNNGNKHRLPFQLPPRASSSWHRHLHGSCTFTNYARGSNHHLHSPHRHCGGRADILLKAAAVAVPIDINDNDQ